MAKRNLEEERSPAGAFFLCSIDKGLDAFGANVRIVVYHELERRHGLKREDIPRKPDLFVETIENLFGVGTAAVSRAIRRELEISSGIKDLGGGDLLYALRTAYHEQLRRLA